jgi:uncharacterized protein YwgA
LNKVEKEKKKRMNEFKDLEKKIESLLKKEEEEKEEEKEEIEKVIMERKILNSFYNEILKRNQILNYWERKCKNTQFKQ